MTKKMALFMWHYFNGDHDESEEEDDNEELNEDHIKGCQSDTDEEPQKNPYPSGTK
jgi:hypothetical protein